MTVRIQLPELPVHNPQTPGGRAAAAAAPGRLFVAPFEQPEQPRGKGDGDGDGDKRERREHQSGPQSDARRDQDDAERDRYHHEQVQRYHQQRVDARTVVALTRAGYLLRSHAISCATRDEARARTSAPRTLPAARG
jgi:hypothetical protein